MFGQHPDLLHEYFQEYVRELMDDLGYSPEAARKCALELMTSAGHTTPEFLASLKGATS